MIPQEYRPSKFSKVSGQKLVIDLLEAIVKNPQEAPKSLILEGEYGTGKTTCARIFAKALNCLSNKSGDACGECSFCKSDIENSIYYSEFDSAMIGNVGDIKEIKDTFYFDPCLGYKVIVLDEAHLMTPQAQSALLKTLEEANSGIFILMCTTHVDKILPTLRSRSLVLKFDLLNKEDIIENLSNIEKDKNIEIDNDILNLIADRSQGHLRDAQILLDKYILLGKDKFLESVKSAKDLYFKLIIASLRKDLKLVSKIIDVLETFPISILKLDYEQMVLDIIKSGLGVTKSDNIYINAIINTFKERIFLLVDKINSELIYSMFTSDKRFQSAMFIISKDIMTIHI